MVNRFFNILSFYYIIQLELSLSMGKNGGIYIMVSGNVNRWVWNMGDVPMGGITEVEMVYEIM